MKELLPLEFYLKSDVVSLARDLIGKLIVSDIEGAKTSGIIVETEAYKAPEDKASHAYNNKLTSRTRTMFEDGGISYIYLVYGFHHLFNVVTGPEGTAHAILVRAIQPVENIELMMIRRRAGFLSYNLTNGPGKWTEAMGINRGLNGVRLYMPDSPIQIYRTENIYTEKEIISSPRIGIPYAQDFIDKPWRFRLKGNAWTGR
ncbi:MAG: DNA-3-methyladenine glycosylase [Saprospiraceae bacterium]|nr:DNA-3-methyladenine glycosylase [Saprospiraceae bacterium]